MAQILQGLQPHSEKPHVFPEATYDMVARNHMWLLSFHLYGGWSCLERVSFYFQLWSPQIPYLK